jgi:hypothetical protein
MIKIVAFTLLCMTLICVAGLGALASIAKRATPPLPAIVEPVVAGNKADRLPTVANEEALKAAEKIEVAYVQPADAVQTSPPAETQPMAKPALPDAKPFKVDERHTARDAKSHRIRRSASRSRRIVSANPPPQQESAPPPSQVSEVKECSSSAISPLLRKLNLSPPCN